MIHTMIITHPLNRQIYDEIFQGGSLLFHTYKSSTNHNRFYVSYQLSNEGFSQSGLRHFESWEGSRRLVSKYQIEIRLNPKRLIEKENLIQLTNKQDLSAIVVKFSKIIKLIHPSLSQLNNWTQKRIDYALDIVTEYVAEYIELAQRADKPSSFKERTLENRHKGQERGSFYLYTNDIAINFYDKMDQIMKQTNEPQILSQAQNILRLEVQLGESKTCEIKNKKGFSTKNVSNFMSKEMALEYILSYYNKTVGQGNYFTLAKAREIINNNSKLTIGTKIKLTKCLELINKKRSVWKAREEYTDVRLFNKYLKLIRNLGINPVTIPGRWGIDFLENPLKKINIST